MALKPYNQFEALGRYVSLLTIFITEPHTADGLCATPTHH